MSTVVVLSQSKRRKKAKIIVPFLLTGGVLSVAAGYFILPSVFGFDTKTEYCFGLGVALFYHAAMLFWDAYKITDDLRERMIFWLRNGAVVFIFSLLAASVFFDDDLIKQVVVLFVGVYAVGVGCLTAKVISKGCIVS